jgi:lipoyl(octanoyl) transferase
METILQHSIPIVRRLGQVSYADVWHAMQSFTDQRLTDTPDEIWLVEHPPVYTQGQAGRPEHLLHRNAIPVVQSDRGGQITYHGPGQLVFYPLMDLRRLKEGVRDFVTVLEQSVVQLLAQYSIVAASKPDAPGVYVNGQKIASLGLRVRHGCTFHGLALNVAMDLSPFNDINPCGYAGLHMTQTSDLGGPQSVEEAATVLLTLFCQQLGISQWQVGEPVFPELTSEETHD